MGLQLTLVSTPNTLETDLESSERVWTPGESTTIHTLEDRSLEKKEEGEEIEPSPTIPTSDADDYPDGGFAAWLVVMGVSRLSISSIFKFFDARSGCIVHMYHFLDVGCILLRAQCRTANSSLTVLSGSVSSMPGECVHLRLSRSLT